MSTTTRTTAPSAAAPSTSAPSAAAESRLVETRSYPPAPAPAGAWNAEAGLYAEASADPLGFWESAARRLDWAEPWHTVLDWTPPTPDPATGELSVPAARWFDGGRLNVAENCVDRHVRAGNGQKVAVHFEGEPGDRVSVTYRDLQERVSRAANALTELGIGPGDRVVVYLPVLVETVVIALACARIGAVHSLVFGGFSAEAVRFRLQDTGAKLLVTSDGQFRRGQAVEVKSAADEAARDLPALEHVLVVRRTGQDVAWTEGRDVWWHESVDRASAVHRPVPFDAEHPLFIIYTSGTTGKPKGLVHTSGGYLAHTSWAHWAHFDARPEDVHWCTADLAWVTAHTYEIYGPLSNGLTQVIYEGTPGEPSRERHLEIIERYGVTVYYTAPTLIRTFMSWFGDALPEGHDLSTLRLLGTVGEAINPEAWVWFRRTFGRDELPVVDTWWQSETGAAMLAPLPGATTLKPGSATVPLPGIDLSVVDAHGAEQPPGVAGTLVARRPWPGMARTVWGDPERYRDSYWRDYAGHGAHGGYYVAGDSATVDADGCFWILGRLDDVVNVSGHRLSTIEIESALVADPSVREAGAAGVDDALTGQAVAVFVIAAGGADVPALDVPALRARVAAEIGPIAKPRFVVTVPDLPRTRSGKIMRRLLAQLVHAERARRAGRTPDPLGDITSLQNPEAVAAVADSLASLPADDPTVAPEDRHTSHRPHRPSAEPMKEFP
ncbi:acetate--CoA ligase [Brachybacterium saurashtrense]|uniref:Acetate--CoA ligase n=1 Tax=Brachybacterium saurashtrense TaxID=556288 RepID=A0A345YQ98_9MICO|nr:acetate--CoA ligase [Brachybacterium saurashtrense]AXK46100.1 acetate--CoA ligase [Brachybacterium saurashtrense]RRR23840.1 acetate--CoA ligase [Brachybacterium saurashtrense]